MPIENKQDGAWMSDLGKLNVRGSKVGHGKHAYKI